MRKNLLVMIMVMFGFVMMTGINSKASELSMEDRYNALTVLGQVIYDINDEIIESITGIGMHEDEYMGKYIVITFINKETKDFDYRYMIHVTDEYLSEILNKYSEIKCDSDFKVVIG